MAWTDKHGRPELFMHPDISRGAAGYRTVPSKPGPSAESDRVQADVHHRGGDRRPA